MNFHSRFETVVILKKSLSLKQGCKYTPSNGEPEHRRGDVI